MDGDGVVNVEEMVNVEARAREDEARRGAAFASAFEFVVRE